MSRFAPPIALMALIFALSAQPDLNSGLGLIDAVGRKVIHAVEFGLLFFLWLRALGYRRPAVAAAITVAYAISDELHQTGVPGRVGSPVDVLIDTVGVGLAWTLWATLGRRRARGRAARTAREPG